MVQNIITRAAALLTVLGAVSKADPVRPYPQTDAYLKTTKFLNHSSYLQGFADQQWYLDNIPFIDVPDKSLLDVYYYRTSVVKRHLKWTHEGHGWVFTEFIHPVSWASKLQTIPDSAAYHVVESRWLRDPNYAKNLIESYTRGGVEKLSGITYTHWMQDAVLEHAQATGDIPFLVSQLDGMISTYYLWNVTRDNTTGLYHRTPLSDAQEYSLPNFLVGGPGGGPMQVWDDFGLSAGDGGGNDYSLIWLGPETYRPNFNAYMVANARAVSQVASLAGDAALSATWDDYASDLYSKMQVHLWSTELQFWIDVVEGTNYRAEGRELIGFFPYRFSVGTGEMYVKGLEASLTPEHFLAEFGPTTLEQDSPYFTALKNTTYCCLWNGQSWPFSTSVYLGTLARMARNNVSSVVTPSFFQQALTTYTNTNYKEGVPFTAEAHYPTIDQWSGDSTNHSENYFHSTYMDNIFTNLLGIVPTLDNCLFMQPLIPSNWSYWAFENIPYHGTLLSIVMSDGAHYGLAKGLHIYSNGTLFHSQPTLGASLNLTLPFDTATAAASLAAPLEWQNILANPNSPWGKSNVTADWTLSLNGDISPWEAWKMNDGLLWFDTTPDNFWTSNQSEVPYSTINVTLPRAREVSSVSLAILADVDQGGVIDCPAGIRVTDSKGRLVAERNPWTDCVPNALNTVVFAPAKATSDNDTTPATDAAVETDFLQITLNDKRYLAVSVSEIQLWVPPVTGPEYHFADGLIGTFIGSFEGRQTGLNGTIVEGGVELGGGGWVELANVRTADSSGGQTSLTLSGGMTGTVELGINWLTNHTVSFTGSNANKTISVDLLRGGNVITVYQTSGTPWVETVTVG